jgi:hypothetical protein
LIVVGVSVRVFDRPVWTVIGCRGNSQILAKVRWIQTSFKQLVDNNAK